MNPMPHSNYYIPHELNPHNNAYGGTKKDQCVGMESLMLSATLDVRLGRPRHNDTGPQGGQLGGIPNGMELTSEVLLPWTDPSMWMEVQLWCQYFQ